jgi:hypothetical protein
MGLAQRIRNALADLLDLRREDPDEPGEGVARQLRAARSLAALSVAHARRRELELHEARESPSPDAAAVAALSAALDDEQRRARRHVERYHALQAQAEAALQRLGEAKRLEALNAERVALDDFAARTQQASDDEAIDRLVDEARAEAAALDALAEFSHAD